MSLFVRTSTDNGALLVRDTDDPFALSVTESTSPLALRVRESTSPLAMRVRGLFSPASLPGLAAWYDASDAATVLTTVSPDVPATDGQTVRRWLDKSGAGRHLNQEALANQPTLTGGRVVTTDSQWMDDTTLSLSQPYSIFAVLRLVSFVSVGRILGTTGGGTSDLIHGTSSGNVRWSAGTTPTLEVTGNLINQTQIVTGTLDSTNSLLAINANTPVTGQQSGTNARVGLRIARSSAGTNNSPVQFLEFGFLAGTISAENRVKTIQYLARRHGITL